MAYPIELDIGGKLAVIIGGGRVAARKLRRLLEEGAKVRLIAPKALPEIMQQAADDKIEWIKQEYPVKGGGGLLVGGFIAFAASGDRKADRAVLRDAGALGIMCNVASEPGRGDFAVPARMKRGEFSIMVSTNGGSPELSRAVCAELDERYGNQWGEFLAWVKDKRSSLANVGTPDERRDMWRRALSLDVLELVHDGKLDEAERKADNAACRFGAES